MSIFNQPIELRPGQIAYLAQGAWRLYVEAIDPVAEKQAYWVRPLILTQQADPYPLNNDESSHRDRPPTALPLNSQATNTQAPDSPPLPSPEAGAIIPISQGSNTHSLLRDRPWYDVREAAHLIWPQTAFRHALDTDILPWLPILHSPNPLRCPPEVKRALQSFLQSLWPNHSA